jgi:hypothetical protein
MGVSGRFVEAHPVNALCNVFLCIEQRTFFDNNFFLRKTCEAEAYHTRTGQEAPARQARKAMLMPVQDRLNPVLHQKTS